MKKIFIFIALTVLSLAWLCYSVRQYSEYVLLYALLSIAGYVSFFITLYRRLKKFRFIMRHIEKTAAAIGLIAPLLFFGYILVLYVSWQRFDWHLYIDNQTDKEVYFTVNGEAFYISAHDVSTWVPFKFHAEKLQIMYNGKNYVFDTSGNYLFNVDSVGSYYIIRHEVEYRYEDITYTFGESTYTVHSKISGYPSGFALTDSITDTIRNQQFILLPRSYFNDWFRYPEYICLGKKTDKKTGRTTYQKPEFLHSIQRIPEYDTIPHSVKKSYNGKSTGIYTIP
ncbi:MAG: hypothetical protein LBD59_06850 [Prevotellaceae bacterium]|jgi:hypothetical protein|nr:hypothetical protein [Prevotellaceae bacterium]